MQQKARFLFLGEQELLPPEKKAQRELEMQSFQINLNPLTGPHYNF